MYLINRKVRTKKNVLTFFLDILYLPIEGSLLTEIKKLLIFENGLLPKKPLDADKGLG